MESNRVVDSSLSNHCCDLFSTNANGDGEQCLHKLLPVLLLAQLCVGKNHVRINNNLSMPLLKYLPVLS